MGLQHRVPGFQSHPCPVLSWCITTAEFIFPPKWWKWPTVFRESTRLDEGGSFKSTLSTPRQVLCFPEECLRPADLEWVKAMLSVTVATGHAWPLNTWNVAHLNWHVLCQIQTRFWRLHIPQNVRHLVYNFSYWLQVEMTIFFIY